MYICLRSDQNIFETWFLRVLDYPECKVHGVHHLSAKKLGYSTVFPSFLQGQNDWAKHGVDFSSISTIGVISPSL